jgi:hypothetical protein
MRTTAHPDTETASPAPASPVSVTFTLRLPAALLAAVDAHLDVMRAKLPSVTITRSDAVRELLAAALDTSGGAK